MIRGVAIACIVLAGGCSLGFLSPDDEPPADDYLPPRPDARRPPPDAPRIVDAPWPWCTGQAYDPCIDPVDSLDCAPGLLCHEFPALGFTACVPPCSVEDPCPPQPGLDAPVVCNQIGLCRPATTNACQYPQ